MITPYSTINSGNIADLLVDDNKLIIPLCKSVLIIMKKCIDPYENEYICYDRNDAPIVGLFTKICRCYGECVSSFSETKSDCIYIYPRIIYEAYIKMCYLIKYGEKARQKYRLIAYKNRYDYYMQTVGSTRGYDKVRNEKFLSDLTDDGFTLEDLRTNKSWKLDGKNFRQLMTDIEQHDTFYSSLYGIGSDSIHSDWADIHQLYLMGDDKMCGNLEPFPTHFRTMIALVCLIIETIEEFIDWVCVEIEEKIFESIRELLQEIDRAVKLIKVEIFNVYENNPNKYMKE